MDTQNISELQNRIRCLESEIDQLKADNAKQEETISWMHDLIWELIMKVRKNADSIL